MILQLGKHRKKSYMGQSVPYMKVAPIVVTILILFACLQTHAQQERIYFDHITTEEGLSQNDVNCILQDQKGFMWFGTNDGLNRYDGYEVTVLKPDPNNPNSISSNIIQSLAQDSSGRLWIGTAGSGLDCFDPNTQQFFNFKHDPNDRESLVNNHIIDLMIDNKGQLWIGTINGLSLFEIYQEDGAVKIHNLTYQLIPNNLQSGRIDESFQDKEGTIWIGNSDGLFRLSPLIDEQGSYQSESIPITSLSNNIQVRSICQDQKGQLVVSMFQGLFYQTGVNDRQMPTFERISPIYYQLIAIDNHNRIWGASTQGLDRLEQKDGQASPSLMASYVNELDDAHSLNKNVLHTIYTDRNGMVWVGANGGGVNTFDPEKMTFGHFKKTPLMGSIGYDKIRSIFEDSNGNIWMGTEGGGLDFLAKELRNNNYDQFQHVSSPNYVFAMEEVNMGNTKYLYFGGQQNPGLYKIQIPSGATEFQARNIIPIPEITGAVFAILDDHERYLWVGTYNQGLFAIDRNSLNSTLAFDRYSFDPQNAAGISNNIIRSLLQDRQGNIWIGTGNGLNMIPATYLKNGEIIFQQYSYQATDPNSLSHNYILALYENRKGDIWVGTFGGGLNKFIPATDRKPAHFISYTEKHGLANDVVKGILEDEQGFLWISTNKGLSRFDPTSETFKSYDTHDGLQSNEFSELACFKLQNGEMLFGGVNGFNAFIPGSFKDNSYLPEVVFTGFQVLNRPISVGEKLNGHVILQQPISNTKHIKLNYDENSFSLEFAALHYSAPGKNQYQYKLEGFNENWISVDAQKRFATYTNLGPGDYTILVKASNNDGVWNHTPSSISISIAPPFWRTWWAYISYAFLIIGLLAAFRRYTIIGIKEKHDLVLEHLEKEKAEELHQMKLQFFTNISHELRTPLTLISGPLDYLIKAGQGLDYGQREHQYHLIQKNANFLLRLVNQLLDFRKLDQGKMKLRVQKGNITSFIQEITEPFQFIANKKQIDYQIISPVQTLELWFDPDILEKTLYNLLSNAFKYTPDKGKISVEIILQLNRNGNKSKAANKWIEIRVRDNGPGIPKEKQEQIFDRFFRAGHREKGSKQGTGIGLSYTKSLIELHHGKIRVESEEGQGACFIVNLPMGQKSYSKQEIAKVPAAMFARNFDPLSYLSANVEEENASEAAAADSKPAALPSLLIIDDHQDIRSYIKQSLSKQYRILEAVDGAQGLEIVQEEMPDIVISDLMMPVMDGIELCRNLKTDPKISHIPLILLTAKSSEESELKGLSTGADAYVRKPFNMDVLKARIQNIIQQRQELKNRFRRELLLEPEEVTVTSADEMFLKKAMTLVEEHMGDPDFNVEVMVKEIGMSRSKLYLKLKALTDQSTSEFIRTVRLKRAVQLLEKSDMTVKEIMYMTGFNTASYFSKCFKKQFGVSPSEYLKKGNLVDA